MSRRKAAAKRVVLPDPLFRSELIAKFMNVVMRCGKKSVAEKIVYGSLNKVLERKSKLPAKSKLEAKESAEGLLEVDDNAGSGGEGDAGSAGGIKVSVFARKVALELFEKVLDVVRPTVEVKSRRVGGATYQVPCEVKPEHGIALAMRWLVAAAKGRNEKSMELRLANEMFDALEGKGGAIKKREEMHKLAKANQAFAHYRW